MTLLRRLARRHRLEAGVVIVAVLDDAGAIRDSVAIGRPADGPDQSRAEPEPVSTILRTATDALDLRRRHELRLAGVRCRTGPAVWFGDDLRWRATLAAEAVALRIRLGPCALVTDHGWRVDDDSAGRLPALDVVRRPRQW